MRRTVAFAIAAAAACGGRRPPSPPPPRLPDTRPSAAPDGATVTVAPRAADTIAHYCANRPACGEPAVGPALAWPAGWTAQFFHDGDSCSAALAIGDAHYILDDLGPTCGDAKFDHCEGRASVAQAGPWVGVITTHPRVNPFADTSPGSPADEEIRICSAAKGFACSDAIAIGKLNCVSSGAGPAGADGLAVDSQTSRLDAKLTATTIRFTWMPGPHDDLLAAGTFTLERSE